MKKIILILISLNILLFSQTINAKYHISYGILSKLGIAQTNLFTNKDNYEIEIKADTVGLAKFLTNNRVEIYKSSGKITNNKYIPTTFTKIRKDNKKTKTTVYSFDHINKKINVNENKDNISRIYELEYYAQDDILSLFFNLNNKLKNFEEDKDYALKAVGANKTNGTINILVPKNKTLKELDTENSTHFIAYINQKIFASKRGELLISLNDFGFSNKTILKDVLLFGDIVGEMVEFNMKKD